MTNKSIIPFGEECYTAQSIDVKFNTQGGVRECAFPFDYVGHTYIESIYNNLYDLLNSNNHISEDDFVFELFNDKYFLCHKKYRFKYWHDVNTRDAKANNFSKIQSFINKYKRRYNRLIDTIHNCKNIVILCVCHFDNIYKKTNAKQQDILKLFKLLKSYNNNTILVAVNFGVNLYDIPDLQFINLKVDFDLPFNESKEKFTKSLYEFTKEYF